MSRPLSFSRTAFTVSSRRSTPFVSNTIISAASTKVKPRYLASTLPLRYSPRLAAKSFEGRFLSSSAIALNSSSSDISMPSSEIIPLYLSFMIPNSFEKSMPLPASSPHLYSISVIFISSEKRFPGADGTTYLRLASLFIIAATFLN